ncbi:Flp pilus assembly protein CpaB [Anaerobacillus alkalilacustris]|uniref:Flp pilus assembly protein CpaB n=1 Tax=Anaerobacillus alkalilacustris TaxID=393763 RepID=A0A1S2LFF5_9BACI|nr:Flp pilus assembly protein CpaB [Anaerobacillus alkalilacustris]OIJ11054.1 Flp pilus assembly protein CpaB [Anaerobacillus alkalilacustris]
MNTKKIWILAIFFGLLMSILVYTLTSSNGNANQTLNEPQLNEQEINDQEDLGMTEKFFFEIQPGKRAISIAVNEVQSVSRFVKPGSYVDVVAILPFPIGEHTSARILLDDIKVLAVGKTFQIENDERNEVYEMVTLEVTPEEGTALAFAKEIGVVTLMLRGADEQETSIRTKISFEDLVKGKMQR